MNSVVLFGAGEIGKGAACYFRKKNRNVKYFIDNDCFKQGKSVFDIPVINLEKYLNMEREQTDLILCLDKLNLEEVEKQLNLNGINDYTIFDKKCILQKERLISYTNQKNLEDVILYHVLRNEKEIFYIDIGSSDPFGGSVTKLLYDTRNAHGINVEPQEQLIKYSNEERPRDINLCLAVGDEKKKMKFFYQGALSTFVPQNVKSDTCPVKETDIITLKEICDLYIEKGTNISFLKIDVEGYEKKVILGADFEMYRPNIIVIESTRPCTNIPTHEEWEYILIEHSYHFVYAYGVNRYYIADERRDLDNEFLGGVEYYKCLYDVYHAVLER